MSHRVAAIEDVPIVPLAPDENLEWHAVRHHLGIRAFGANAYVGRAPGDLVIEPHDEDEPEELYAVIKGTATFTVDDETFDAPAGTLVFVTPRATAWRTPPSRTRRSSRSAACPGRRTRSANGRPTTSRAAACCRQAAR